MKLISLAQKLQQLQLRFHWIHLRRAQDPVQPELIQQLGKQKSLNKLVPLAMKYVHAISVLRRRVHWEFVNSEVQEIG